MKSFAFLSLLALTGSALAEPIATKPHQSTCPKIFNPECSFICGQKSIDFWYCSDKNIFPSPTDDNWCTPCPRGKAARDLKNRLPSRRDVDAIKLSDVGVKSCPKKKDPACRFICGKEGLDILFCSKKNIVIDDKGDENWCFACIY
ncbi:hypothetical protein TWF718_006589 [Orbilia javanica]|uniref:Uncharacterized protein n=1 Tax=Orbilia javanica TaxID=47235 RepID=A0AAN8MX71_9PEZI